MGSTKRETWYLSRLSDAVLLRARFEGPGGQVGDPKCLIRPGDVVAGLDYDGWRALPEGPVVLASVDGVVVAVEPRTTEEPE